MGSTTAMPTTPATVEGDAGALGAAEPSDSPATVSASVPPQAQSLVDEARNESKQALKPSPQKPLKSKPPAAAKPPGLRQSMSSLHTWLGLLAGWCLYAMFLTGSVSYFRDELTLWMRPELPQQTAQLPAAELATRVVAQLQERAANSPQWSITLPARLGEVASASWRVPQPPVAQGAPGAAAPPRRGGFQNASFDPATGDALEQTARATRGGDFFFRFHFQFHYMPVFWGRWLAGLCAMFMLIAIVSGVITHKKIFTDFFTFRSAKGQRSWLDAHNALSVFGLPFHLMITYTGLVTLMFMYVPWAREMALDSPQERQAMNSQLFYSATPLKPEGVAAPLASVADMVLQAEHYWGAGAVGRVVVDHPGDAAAQVALVRGNAERVTISPQAMVFDGTAGALLQAPATISAAAETRGVLYGLHVGRFSDWGTRWLFFISSLIGTAMVGTGLVLWTVKRRTKLKVPDKPYVGFWLVERLNIATIAGLSSAMAAMLWANRLLPIEMANRSQWEVHTVFIVWGLALLWALVRPARRAWVELLCVAAVALALLPLLNGWTTERGLWASLQAGDGVYVGLDLSLLALAALHGWAAYRAARYKPKVKAAKAQSKTEGADRAQTRKATAVEAPERSTPVTPVPTVEGPV